MKHGTGLQGCPSLGETGRGRVARTEAGLDRGGGLVSATGEGSKVAYGTKLGQELQPARSLWLASILGTVEP